VGLAIMALATIKIANRLEYTKIALAVLFIG
jgi:hypothetical protein